MCSDTSIMSSSTLPKMDNFVFWEGSSSGGLETYMKSPASLSTDSSDFEFDSIPFAELNDELPVSPKLNYYPNWESATVASTNQFFSQRKSISTSMNSIVVQQVSDEYATFNLQFGAGLVNQIKVNDGDYGGQKGSLSSRGKSENIVSGDDQIKGEKQEFSSSLGRLGDVIRVNDGIKADNCGGQESKRVNLRSLLDRRELEQLPPIQKLQGSSSPSPSFSASYSSSPHRHYDDQSPCRSQEDHHAETVSTPKSCRSCHEKKSKKWAFNLDFLRRTVPSSRSDQHLNRGASSDQADNYRIKHSFNDQLNHNSRISAAAAEEDRIDDQRFEHYSVAATAAEITKVESPRHAAAAAIRKTESPRKSTGSLSHVSSSIKYDNDVIKALKHDNEVIRATRRVSRSAPISPAASPPRSSGAGGVRGAAASPSKEGGVHTRRVASPRWAGPMSPHALHYQQQKARAEELRRRTFLPYRQSLLSACFFPANQLHPTPPPAHHPQQPAVVY
eukprot:c17310_g1_i1 orf=268-1776(+)